MSIQLELWHLILLLTMFFGVVFAFGKLLLAQFEARFDERLKRIEAGNGKANEIEIKLLELRAELPHHYVRREDYVIGQSVIMAKLDAVFTKIENLQLKVLP